MFYFSLHIRYIYDFRYVPESVRWLRTKKKLNEAEDILKKIGKINRRFTNASLSELPEGADKNTSYNDLFITFSMAMSTLVQCYTW